MTETIYSKDALLPGPWHVPDGYGGTRLEVFSPERIQHLGTRLSEMLDDQINVPLCKEHQPRAKPFTPDEYEQFLKDSVDLLVGHTKAGEFDSKTDKLMIEVVTPTEEDARAVEKIQFISPMIDIDFKDGKGKVWPGESITHFALTPRPVQHGQKPFQPITNRLNGQNGVAMSQAGANGQSGDGRYPFCLSIEGHKPLKLSEVPVDDETNVSTAETPPEKKPGESNGEIGEANLDAEPEVDHFEECLPLLTEHGIVLPDDTTEKNFCERLKTCLVGLKGRLEPKGEGDNGNGEGEMGGEGGMGAVGGASQTPQPVEQSPLTMSLQRQLKTEREKRAKLEASAKADKRASLTGRIDKLKLSKFILESDAAALLQRAKTIRLSLSSEPTDLELELAGLERGFKALEAAAKRAAFTTSPTKLSKGDPEVVEPPEEPWDGKSEMPPDREKKVLDFYNRKETAE